MLRLIIFHHSNVSHGQHEGHRDVSEKSSKVNTDIGESKEGDGGDEINLKYVF